MELLPISPGGVGVWGWGGTEQQRGCEDRGGEFVGRRRDGTRQEESPPLAEDKGGETHGKLEQRGGLLSIGEMIYAACLTSPALSRLVAARA